MDGAEAGSWGLMVRVAIGECLLKPGFVALYNRLYYSIVFAYFELVRRGWKLLLLIEKEFLTLDLFRQQLQLLHLNLKML